MPQLILLCVIQLLPYWVEWDNSTQQTHFTSKRSSRIRSDGFGSNSKDIIFQDGLALGQLNYSRNGMVCQTSLRVGFGAFNSHVFMSVFLVLLLLISDSVEYITFTVLISITLCY